MSRDVLPQSGELKHLDEVVQQGMALRGRAVRVLGHLVSYDAATASALISHRGCTLAVNTSLVPACQYRPTSLMQFIGEVVFRRVGEREALVLDARIVRCVDGLDEQLFEKALAVRRSFEAQLRAEGSGGGGGAGAADAMVH